MGLWRKMVASDGLEPSTPRLSAERSPAELRSRDMACREGLEPPTCGFGDRCPTCWATGIRMVSLTWSAPRAMAQGGSGLRVLARPRFGGASEDRTRDILLAKQALSHLSYDPVIGRRGGTRTLMDQVPKTCAYANSATRPMKVSGRSGRARTDAARVKSSALYPLSYGPVAWSGCGDSNPGPPAPKAGAPPD